MIVFASLLLVCWLAEASAAEPSSCVVCHSDVQVKYSASAHAGEVTCVGCHGGDAARFDLEAHSEEAGYKGALSRVAIVELCASCHSDPVQMRAYNLRADQYSQYLTSPHGQQLFKGDPRVAICTDCHSTHEILPASEPRSTTYPSSVPKTCAHCHADKKVMATYGLPADQYDQFRKSVHGRALEEDDSLKSPNCATCHGTHGATPPQVEDISRVCGQCHSRERSYFNESPHKAAMDALKFSECGACHGDHAVEEPKRSLFNTACLGCHKKGSKEMLEGRKIMTFLDRAEEALRKAEAAAKEATASGIDVSVHRSRLPMAWASLTEALAVQHTLDAERVEELTRNARSVGEEVQGAVHAATGEKELRTIGLLLVWFFLLCTATVAYLYKREVARERALE